MKKKLDKKYKFASWLLKICLPDYLSFTALGDYEEIYDRIRKSQGKTRAGFWLFKQVVRSIPQSIYWGMVMAQSYMKITIRNIKRQKMYSFINIIGLALGITSTLLIMLWVRDELSFDRFHEQSENIFQVALAEKRPDFTYHTYATSAQMAIALKQEFPEVIQAAAFNGRPRVLFKRGENAFYEDGLAITENSFFKIFSFPFIKGDPESALSDPSSVVITEAIAKKYFGDEDPMGKTLEWNNWVNYKVTGVVREPPRNSSISFDFIKSHKTLEMSWPEGFHWETKIFRTYVKLKENVAIEQFSERVTETVARKYPRFSNHEDKIYFQPISRIHLHALGGGGSIKYVYIFSLIAVFILIIACINFTNLSTARSANRAREVGLRKVVGSNRRQLVQQFFGESIFLVFVAFILALLLLITILPWFNRIAGKELVVEFFDPVLITGSLLLIFATGILSGSYPSLYLSSFSPSCVLKGTMGGSAGKAVFRKTLVVFQFTLSIGFIIGTAVVFQQLDFLRNKELGFNKDNVVYIPYKANIGKNYTAVKERLLQDPNILAVSAKDRLPTKEFDTGLVEWEGQEPGEKLTIEYPWVDYDYFKTLNMELLEGRVFAKEYTSDVNSAFIINEAAQEQMGLESPLGKQVVCYNNQQGKIIGVVKNAFFRSRQEKVKAELYRLIKNYAGGELDLFGVVLIKIRSSGMQAALSSLENIWRSVNPDYPFEYHFLDEALDGFYKSEMKIKTISSCFAVFAVFISCLGLFGLAAFTAEKRRREIGVRRVLGASSVNIVCLLSAEFVKWVIWANLFAWPIAFLFLNSWLQNYAYRISIEWWLFFAAGAISFIIALLTVAYQAFRSAYSNPVESLRDE